MPDAKDAQPVAAASVGQVHRAVWRDGTDVAVEVLARRPRARARRGPHLGPRVRVTVPPTQGRPYLLPMEVGPVGGDAGAFQAEVLSLLPAFWGGRDVRHLHHPVWFRQLGETAVAARDEAGDLHGYLLGARTPRGGYAHVIATLSTVRGRGTGRALYAGFAALLAASAGTTVEAITTPGNTGSVAFHRRLGFTATLVEDYAGPGEDRVHFAVDARTLLEAQAQASARGSGRTGR